MKHYFSFLLVFIILSFSSCRDEFDFEPSVGELRFSKDTVYLDTVFTNIGSSTYTLKVYNKTNKNISIPKVQLAKGEASKYRLMVDGIPGKVFENVELLAKDSMFVFVEVTADVASANPTDFLYTDQIQFGNTTNFQKVELVTLIQDAYFIYPQRTQNPDNTYTYEQLNLGTNDNPEYLPVSYLDESDPINGNELYWNNSKPYVVYGYAVIPPTKTLEVQPGARVHFHADSGIIVANNASLKVMGEPSNTDDLENEVIFEGDRLEYSYSEVPGQWGTVWFTQGSHSNEIKNLTLKNATVGLLVTGNDESNTTNVNLHNVQIYNASNVGILARNGFVEGKNVVINNCGQSSLACTLGGSYEFTHCTFANYWATPNHTCLLLNNYYELNSEEVIVPLIKADFKNCIFYGSSNLALKHDIIGNNYDFLFDKCLLKFIDSNNQFTNETLYKFTTNPKYQNCIIASSSNSNKPDFLDPNNNKLNIGENSIAKGNANPLYSSGTYDILNNERNEIIGYDIGAYNWITFD